VSETHDIARRVHIQHDIVGAFPLAERALHSGACPSLSDSRRLTALTVAMGDLASALERGHSDIEGELHMVCAMAQLWLEDRERVRADGCLP
jgi:hypothetical protein